MDLKEPTRIYFKTIFPSVRSIVGKKYNVTTAALYSPVLILLYFSFQTRRPARQTDHKMGKPARPFGIAAKKISTIVTDPKKKNVYSRTDCLTIKKRNWFENLANLNT